MTRRNFLSLPAAALGIPPCRYAFCERRVDGDGIALRAVAATRLPLEATIVPVRSRYPGGLLLCPTGPIPEELRYVELRVYGASIPGRLPEIPASLFDRVGIRPLFHSRTRDRLVYLIHFDDLAARERAWSDCTADPAWARLRDTMKPVRIALFQPAIRWSPS